MIKKKVACAKLAMPALALILSLQSPAHSQYRYAPPFPQVEPITPQVVSSLGAYATTINTGKPPGIHTAAVETTFHSDYPKAPLTQKAQFALELHNFVLMQGGGYDAFMQCYATSAPALSGSDPHVKYAKQAEFTEFWWRTHNEQFKNMAPFFKDWWIHDSILDATNLYERWSTACTHDFTSSHLMYIDSELALLKNKR